MSVSKFVILTIFLSLILTHVRAEASVDGKVSDSEDEAVKVVRSDTSVDSSALKVELDNLKSKIHDLESHVDKKSKELQAKEEIISEKEKIVQVKSDIIASLQSEITSLQKKGTLDAEKQVGKAHARAGELEKKIDKLKREQETQHKEKQALEARVNEAEEKAHQLSLELESVDKLKREQETQQKDKVALEARVNEAEEKAHQLSLKLESLQKTKDEQKTRIRKIERALKVAEEEMIKAKSDAIAKAKELMEYFMETHWNERGKPAMEMVIQKVVEKKAQAEKWAAPHIETIKTKWIPTVEEQWVVLKTNAEPHVQSLTKKTIEVYEASKSKVTPHIVQVREFVDPYFQEVKKFSKPHVDQIAAVTKPHVDKVRVAIKPHTTKVVHAYGKFLQSATTYHNQIQASVQEMLKRHELTRPLATKELEWFAASSLLALPIIVLFRIFSAIFWKKAKKPVRNNHTNQARRKAKRGHPEK
ncbi:hypothetical protein CJ030_MR8G028132 [Morella rubra]|uniref:Uncharacterized protein n=1 Tax=Morella rubra TaxID=262757 RepID=A0A6A1UVQ8_9ROSI|nr:hypothetical protein CJ030_MR8G028132 [Morella rubra]